MSAWSSKSSRPRNSYKRSHYADISSTRHFSSLDSISLKSGIRLFLVMSTPAPHPRLEIDDTYGAALIGALFTAMLYGLTTLQTYFYFVYYPKDGKEIKSLVSLVWVLDTVQTILVSVCMYHYLVTNYANPPALAIGHWSLFVSVAMNVTIAFLVQCFFTVRIFRLSNPKIRWWLSSIIGLVVLAHFCFGIETVVFLFIKKELRRLPEITLIAATPFAALAVLSDIFIAAALCILLHGSRTGFRRTNTLVTTLIIYAINRCLLTSVVAVAEVIVFSLSPHSLWYLAIDFVIGKLYANSLLATLNSRNALRTAGASTMASVPLSDVGFYEESRGEDATQRGVVINLSHKSSHRTGATNDTDTLASKRHSGDAGV